MAAVEPSRCPYCNAEATTPGEEMEHMTRVHPEVVEARLLEAGVARFELPLLGRERSLCDGQVRELVAAVAAMPRTVTRGPRDTRRGAAFEYEVAGDDRPRRYGVEVVLVKT